MSEENKDLTPKGDKPSETSTPPEGTGEKKSSSPGDASASKEGVTEEVHESLKTQYAESSKEAKRLKGDNDAKDESLKEKDDYIESLEIALDKKDGKPEDKGTDGDKSKDKKPEDKKPDEKKAEPETKKESTLPPHLTKEGQRKAMEELLGEDKAKSKEADKLYNAALKEFPRLKNEAFARLVSSKMKSDKLSVKDACKKVDEDLKTLGGKEGDEEPFVEGGAGESTVKAQETEETDIKDSLKRPSASGDLPGMV